MIDIYEVVKKIVGEIKPIGDSYTDEVRFENLQRMTELIGKLFDDVNDLVSYKNQHQYSMKKSAEFADKFLSGLERL